MTDPFSLDHQLTGVIGDVADLLIGAEQRHHELGWDNTPPMLYGIWRSPTGEYGTVTARLGQFVSDRAADDLATLATAVEDPRGAELLAVGYPHPPVAHMVIAEAWSRGSLVGAEACEGDTRAIADIPGSVELRFGIAVVGKRCIMLERTRGAEPRLLVEDTEWQAEGNLVDALKRVQAAMAHATGR